MSDLLSLAGASMLDRFPESQYMPCPHCGASVARMEMEGHTCERERWLDYQMFQEREELDRLASELVAYLESTQGRFELWCAERERRRNERRNETG